MAIKSSSTFLQRIGKSCFNNHSIRCSSSTGKPIPHQTTPDEVPPVTKPSLVDLFGRQHTYLRISLTEKCNLRCQYCMPKDGVKLTEKSRLLSTDEVLHLAKLFVDQGITKIRLTGGEPTIHKDLLLIVQELRKIKGLNTIGITTNGLALTKQLVALQKAGLDSVNISLDTLKPERYEFITRRKGWSRVLAGIDLAVQLGYDNLKVNVVVMKNFNDDEILDFVNLTRDRPIDVRFIEYMPFSGNEWNNTKIMPFNEMLTKIKQTYPNLSTLENAPNDTSKAYKVPEFSGRLGFITSMTEHFCGSCNRLRLMADGSLKVCLFGNTEISLRDALREGCSEEDLVTMIEVAVKRKKKQHADLSIQKTVQNLLVSSFIEMSHASTTVNSFVISEMNSNRSRTPNSTESISMPFLAQSVQKLESPFERTSLKTQSPTCTTQRAYSKLTHVSDSGSVNMVDVGPKAISKRTAKAEATVLITPEISRLIRENLVKKGDVLTIAQIAGIMGAKKTHELIPLCHSIALSKVDVQVRLCDVTDRVFVKSSTVTYDRTGVEMEALVGAMVAAATVYDMCKAVSKGIEITGVRLLEKTGGTRGDYVREKE
uniref:Molybdenum cofactor biosynthesis protein 1 n=1 Tax=Cacopsylla melanoneura TaxID=428564 RepID=A0A8D8QW41_9HEMI